MQVQTQLTVEGEWAYVETEDPVVVAQLEELDDAERVGESKFVLPASSARLHFPHAATG
jgi:hypothetical protein